MILVLQLLAGLLLGLALGAWVHHLDTRMRRVEAAFEVLRRSTLEVLKVVEVIAKDYDDRSSQGRGGHAA